MAQQKAPLNADAGATHGQPVRSCLQETISRPRVFDEVKSKRQSEQRYEQRVYETMLVHPKLILVGRRDELRGGSMIIIVSPEVVHKELLRS